MAVLAPKSGTLNNVPFYMYISKDTRNSFGFLYSGMQREAQREYWDKLS